MPTCTIIQVPQSALSTPDEFVLPSLNREYVNGQRMDGMIFTGN
jgi:hypothetical protein